LTPSSIAGADVARCSFSGVRFSGMQFDGITLAGVDFTNTDLWTTSYHGGFQNSVREMFHYLCCMRSGTEARANRASKGCPIRLLRLAPEPLVIAMMKCFPEVIVGPDDIRGRSFTEKGCHRSIRHSAMYLLQLERRVRI
jgi:hypothetical protein